MKKSSTVRLVLLGSAGIALGACGDDGPPKDAKFFSSLNECSSIHGEASCQDAKTASEKIHLAEAPRFGRQQECEAQFGAGNCETRQAGASSFFLPLMAGYMMGKMSGGGAFNQPVYRGPNNAAVMPSGGRVFNVGSFAGTGAGAGGAAIFKPAQRIAAVTRGGFGQTASIAQTSSGG